MFKNPRNTLIRLIHLIRLCTSCTRLWHLIRFRFSTDSKKHFDSPDSVDSVGAEMSELPGFRNSRHSPLRLSELPGFRNFVISQTESAESDLGIHWISSRISRINRISRIRPFLKFATSQAESAESRPIPWISRFPRPNQPLQPLSQNLAIPGDRGARV